MTQRIGIYAGTFDPITVGHLDIIRRSLRVVDTLIIGVALDSGKQPIFDVNLRAELVRQDIADVLMEEGARVEVYPFSGLLINFAREHGAKLLIRGLRAVSDYEYEFQMACMNNTLDPEMETVFLTASEGTHFISSRFVKQVAKLGGDVGKMVSLNVARHLEAFFEANSS